MQFWHIGTLVFSCPLEQRATRSRAKMGAQRLFPVHAAGREAGGSGPGISGSSRRAYLAAAFAVLREGSRRDHSSSSRGESGRDHTLALCDGSGRGCLPFRFRKRKKPFFFSGVAGRPQAVLAIWRIALEMGESCNTTGLAVFWVRRAVA